MRLLNPCVVGVRRRRAVAAGEVRGIVLGHAEGLERAVVRDVVLELGDTLDNRLALVDGRLLGLL